METELQFLEVLNGESLTTSLIISVKQFPYIVRNTKHKDHLHHSFDINNTFNGTIKLYPLGVDPAGANISMVLNLASITECDFTGTIQLSLLNKDGEKEFITNGMWAVLDGPRIADIMDAKYLIGGTLRIQLDLTLNYQLVQDHRFWLARCCLRKLMQYPIFGDSVFRVQRNYNFNVHRDILCKYHETARSLVPDYFNDRHKPVYELASTDPYSFQKFAIDCYMYDTLSARSMRG